MYDVKIGSFSCIFEWMMILRLDLSYLKFWMEMWVAVISRKVDLEYGGEE